MKTILLILALSLTLAACGVRGDPVAPGKEPAEQSQ